MKTRGYYLKKLKEDELSKEYKVISVKGLLLLKMLYGIVDSRNSFFKDTQISESIQIIEISNQQYIQPMPIIDNDAKNRW